MSDTPLYAEIYTRSSGTRTYGEKTQMSGGRADGWTGLSSPQAQEPIQVYGPICAPQEYPSMSAVRSNCYVIDYLSALDNVPVSGGDSRECRKLWTDPWCTY